MFAEHNMGEVNTVSDTLYANNNTSEKTFNLKPVKEKTARDCVSAEKG